MTLPLDAPVAPTTQSRRNVIRTVIFLILVSQALVVTAFLTHTIDEPYPAIILPAFDQVLADPDGTYAFVLPRFVVRLASGKTQELSADTLFRNGGSINGARAYWVVSRLAPPPKESNWVPSLATYGYTPKSRQSSPAFLSWLAGYAATLPSVKSPVALSIVWERRRFSTQMGSLKELEPMPLGTIEVPVKNSTLGR